MSNRIADVTISINLNAAKGIEHHVDHEDGSVTWSIKHETGYAPVYFNGTPQQLLTLAYAMRDAAELQISDRLADERCSTEDGTRPVEV